MLKNYLLLAYRNLLKNKLFSLVNIFGLAVGMAACFLIFQFVRFELSYDRFHKQSERIFRVTLDSHQSSGQTRSAANHPGAGPALKSEYPEVLQFARVVHQSIFMGVVTAWSYVDDQNNIKVFNEERVYNVDPSFLTLFSFPFVFGDPEKAFPDVNSVVISQTVSNKFFGHENPLGKVLLLDGHRPFTIRGVFEDVPENSHLKFDILVSYFLTDAWGGGWDHSWDWKWPEYYTYVLLDPNADPDALEAKLPGFIQKYMGDRMKEMKSEERFHLQPVTDIHLRSPNLTKEREVHGSDRTVYFLLIIGVLILIIAWINYINLSTSKSIDRAQEVGLRKVAGASRSQLVTQFLLESAMVNFLAMVLSFLLIVIALPYFNQLTGKNISASIQDLAGTNQSWFWPIVAGIFMLGSFFSGLYPAFVLSSFRIVTVIKGKFFGSKSGVILRKILVGSQFIISVALIVGTVIVFRQVSFMQDQALGYKKDQLVVIKAPRVADSTIFNRMDVFKTELKRNTKINSVASSNQVPGNQISQMNFVRNVGEGTEGNFLCFHFAIDEEFMNTYDIDLMAGRNFREEGNLISPDAKSNPVMLNEKAVALLGFKSPEEAVNKLFTFGLGTKDWVGEIVGVVANHHQQSLKNGYDPIMFFSFTNFFGQYYTINLNMQNSSETIAFVKEQYERSFPGNQFEYFFLDEYFNRQYAADQQFGRVFGLFSSLALIVAGLGLFGLSTFMISQRIKEIAVRKVLGATIPSMVYLFSKDFVKLVILANLVALPMVYMIVDSWLSSFAFHVPLGWMMFVIPPIVLLIISLATVSLQTIRTGSVNPVRSLRSE